MELLSLPWCINLWLQLWDFNKPLDDQPADDSSQTYTLQYPPHQSTISTSTLPLSLSFLDIASQIHDLVAVGSRTVSDITACLSQHRSNMLHDHLADRSIGTLYWTKH